VLATAVALGEERMAARGEVRRASTSVVVAPAGATTVPAGAGAAAVPVGARPTTALAWVALSGAPAPTFCRAAVWKWSMEGRRCGWIRRHGWIWSVVAGAGRRWPPAVRE
jgi:hypothetical protein